VVVNYDTPESEYSMSMTAEDSYGVCGPFSNLRKMLLGSGMMWRSSCKKGVPHVLVIEPVVGYTDEEWIVQYLTFKLKGAKKVEVYVDDQLVYSVSYCISIALHNELHHHPLRQCQQQQRQHQYFARNETTYKQRINNMTVIDHYVKSSCGLQSIYVLLISQRLLIELISLLY